MTEPGKHPLGLAGGLTRAFIASALTPLFILAALVGAPFFIYIVRKQKVREL